VAGGVDADEAGVLAVLIVDTSVGADLVVEAEPILAALAHGAGVGAAGVALVVQAGAVAALEVEDAEGREVGASAVDAELAVVTLAIIDATALAIGARTLVGDAHSSIVAGEAGTDLVTVRVGVAASGGGAGAFVGALGDVAEPVVAVLVAITGVGSLFFARNACVTIVADIA
jgi:hypothetical protein